MKEGYRFLGEYIRQVDIRNKEGKKENLLGVSVQKQFIQSIANTVGTDFTKYKIVKKGQFTYIPDTSRRGDKIAIALLEDYEEGLVSNVYTVFEVIDTEKLLPEYLMLWFSRPEFDRYARFKSHGSVREVMDWEEMCKVELPVPDIEKQRKIVKAYKTITDRIDLKQKINDNLEATAQAILQDKICSNGIETTVDNLINLFDSMRRPLSGLERSEMKRTYPYYGAASLMDYVDDYIFDGVYGLLGEDGTVMDDNGYPTMQYVWGKFWVNNHAHIFQGKNGYSTEMVYLILKNTIVRNAVTGAVQLKINQENLRKLSVVVPCDDNLTELNTLIDKVFLSIRENRTEIQYLTNLKDILLAELSD